MLVFLYSLLLNLQSLIGDKFTYNQLYLLELIPTNTLNSKFEVSKGKFRMDYFKQIEWIIYEPINSDKFKFFGENFKITNEIWDFTAITRIHHKCLKTKITTIEYLQCNVSIYVVCNFNPDIRYLDVLKSVEEYYYQKINI